MTNEKDRKEYFKAYYQKHKKKIKERSKQRYWKIKGKDKFQEKLKREKVRKEEKVKQTTIRINESPNKTLEKSRELAKHLYNTKERIERSKVNSILRKNTRNKVIIKYESENEQGIMEKMETNYNWIINTTGDLQNLKERILLIIEEEELIEGSGEVNKVNSRLKNEINLTGDKLELLKRDGRIRIKEIKILTKTKRGNIYL